MKDFTDNLIGVGVVLLGIMIGGACMRYIITGAPTHTIVEKQPIIVPNVTITNQGDKTCWQFIGGECTK